MGWASSIAERTRKTCISAGEICWYPIIPELRPWEVCQEARIPVGNFLLEEIRVFSDRTLTCCDCGQTFVFTAGEQEFYNSKGFSSDPRRCPECRRNHKRERENGSLGRSNGTREMFEVVCAECGKTAKVPVRPRNDKPVYCAECFKNHGGARH